MLGEKRCLKPVVIASSQRKRSNAAASSSSTSSNIDNTTSDIDDVENSKETSTKSKKPKTRMKRELELWAKTLSEESRKRDEVRERRHQELLARPDRAQKLMNILTKLLEKL